VKRKLRILRDIERSNFTKARHYELHGEINLNKSLTRDFATSQERGSSTLAKCS